MISLFDDKENMHPGNQIPNFDNKYYNTEYPDQKRSLLGYFFNYIKKPYYIEKFDEKSLRLKFWDMFRILSATLIIAIIIGIIISIVLLAVGYDTGDHALSDPKYQNPFTLFFLGVILAPLLEEAAFRMGLKFSPFRLSFSLALLSYFFYPSILSFIGINLTKELTTFIPLILLIVIGLFFGFIFRILNENQSIERFYKKYFFIIFYSLVVIFAIVHIMNYSNFNQIWFLTPLIVAPQFLGGITMGFIRINFGLQWSIIQHMLWNGFLFSPSIFLSYVSSRDFNNLSTMDITLVSLLSITIIGIFLAVLISGILILVEYVQKEK